MAERLRSSVIAPSSPFIPPSLPHALLAFMQLCASAEMTKLEAHVSSLGGALSLGWSVRLTWRAKGTRAGTYDTIFCSPNGCEYRSKVRGQGCGSAPILRPFRMSQTLHLEPTPAAGPVELPSVLNGSPQPLGRFHCKCHVRQPAAGHCPDDVPDLSGI